MHVLAEITPKPEHMDDALEAVRSIIARTRAEAGCNRFEVYTDEAREMIVLVEHWADREAFDFHHAQSYVTDIFAKYDGWLESPPRIVNLVTAELST